MSSVHIQKQLASETVPELKPFIGKSIDIYVFESSRPAPASVHLTPPPSSSRPQPTLDQLAAEQGISLRTVEELRGGWPAEELNDGFEKTLEQWRLQDIEAELERRARE